MNIGFSLPPKKGRKKPTRRKIAEKEGIGGIFLFLEAEANIFPSFFLVSGRRPRVARLHIFCSLGTRCPRNSRLTSYTHGTGQKHNTEVETHINSGVIPPRCLDCYIAMCLVFLFSPNYERRTYWEHSENKTSHEPLRARISN